MIDTDDLRLGSLTASDCAQRISLSVQTKGLDPDPYVDLCPDDALKLGEWLVARARARGAAHQTIRLARRT